jgi:sulfur carrier protein
LTLVVEPDTGVGSPSRSCHDGVVKVLLRNPTREIEIDGAMSVNTLLQRLELNRESFLVIRGDELVPGDAPLAADDHVEIRPVISGGSVPEGWSTRVSCRGAGPS